MTGEFTEIVAPTTLAYTWRVANWKDSWVDSLVRWELTPVTPDTTAVYLTHDRLPNISEREGHEDGWENYFLDPVMEWCENRSKDN